MRSSSLRARARRRLAAALLVAAVAGPRPANADEALVAVAASFAEVVAALEPRFEAETGHALTVTTGSTGKLYAQVSRGAPFHVLLAADAIRPARLEREGLAVAGSRFTYAVGRLALWSPGPARVAADGARTLAAGDFRALAMANPELAPYGAAARQVLAALGLLERLRGRIVVGENVGQAYAMVATGNAELGFVALAQVLSPRNRAPGSHWQVPGRLHDPIRQDAVLLAAAAGNRAAPAFLAFLRRPEARAFIAGAGYGVE